MSLALQNKPKTKYYENLNERCVTDNKIAFWNTVKAFLSDKIMIFLTENDEFVKTDKQTAEYSTEFFSNLVQNCTRYKKGSDPVVNGVRKNSPKKIARKELGSGFFFFFGGGGGSLDPQRQYY